ncbi:MAG: helix-turn-helix domain-containing protein [Paracoccaceae bacterium]
MEERTSRDGGDGGELFLREHELARRWRKSTRSLQRWRVDGTGPAFVRIGGSIRYRLDDVLAYESAARADRRASS